jgi:NitT/TauT family transport system ATP-binding protein
MVAHALKSSTGVEIDIRGVSHRFDLEGAPLPVLNRINLTASPGEFVALLGPSGCGKSTLLRLVAGLEPPSEGEISADGVKISGPHPSRVVVFQDPTLFPWRNVRDNVALGLEAQGLLKTRGVRIEETLRLVGLDGFAKAYPHQLSGGMAQRVSLARALVNDPDVLILDEPLGKLDSLTRLTMQGEMVTHDIEEALLMATRVIVFSERPATVKADIAWDKPYPRHRDDRDLVARRREILGLLGLDASW